MAIRAFFAVDLDEPARQAAAALARQLEERSRGVRWVRPENYHVTLRFLGNIESGAVNPLTRAARQAVREMVPFRLRLGAAALFPSARRPRVVAVELEPEVPLRRLGEALEGAVVRAGFPPETRRFRAHLTLGRIAGRSAAPPACADAAGEAEFVVREVILFQSQLRPQGAHYTPLERIPLGQILLPDPTSKGEDHGKE